MTSEPTATETGTPRPWRWGIFFAGVWLFYLVQPLRAGWNRGDLRGWVGMAAILVFAAVYLVVFWHMRMQRRIVPVAPFSAVRTPALGLAAVGVEIALGVLICWCVGEDGVATAVYVAVLCVMCLPRAWGWIVSVLVAAAAYTATLTVPGWEEDQGILFGTLVATLAIWGIATAINRNVEVLQVREENTRLELADERNRFARDLHDILGHSLTVITVKAELASRLFDVDADRARAELADLERLSRDALADVRRAVEGYRELTLPGELARARAALSAAEIDAVLPNSTDEVPTERRELFAWTVREGITNVIRHSAARCCQVTLSADAVEIRDDGRGPSGGTPGHGLVGLRERAAAVGATVVTETLDPGFSLRVVCS
jgi:two-component system sensor histidine kinase DesK